MRSRLLPSVALAALLAAGCSGGGSTTTGDAPVVLAVSPNSGTPSAAVEVTVTGQHFTVRTMQLQGGGTSVLLPRVFFGTTELAPVTWVDDGTLKVTVPQDFPAGSYAVTVENGFGVRGQPLADGYLVAATPPVLTATWSASQYTVMLGQPVTVTMVLANAAGSAPASVTALTPTASPTASCSAANPAASTASPVRVNGGASVAFSWTCTAATSAASGPYLLNASLTVVDALTGNAVTPTLNGIQVTYTALPVLSLTVNGNGNGAVTSQPAGIAGCNSAGGTNCSAAFSPGTQVTLTATPGAGVGSVAWTGCDSSPTANSCRVTMGNSPRAVTAAFTLSRFAVTVSPTAFTGSAGTGTVSSSPAGITACAVGGGGTCTAQFDFGTNVTLTATPGVGSNVSWTAPTQGVPGCTSSNGNTCTITNLSAAHTVGAVFALNRETLTVQAPTNGVLLCGATACATSFAYGDTVTMTATPNPGFNFQGWNGGATGAGPCDSETTTTCTFHMTQNWTVGATFTAANQNLMLATNPAGSGTLLCNGQACAAVYATGTPLSITAAAVAGYTFAGWTGGCAGTTGPTCSVTMPAAGLNATANFTAQQQNLTVTASPTAGGTLACNTGPCAATYPTGTSVTVTHTAAQGYAFTGWSGACSGAGTCTFTMPPGGTIVTAAFAAQPQSLTVAANPTAAVNAFACNGAPCLTTYPTGTAMSITPTANDGYSFSTWSAPCTNLTAATCTFAMPAGGTAVTATFTAGTQPLNVTVTPTGSGIYTCNTGSGPGPCAASYSTGTALTLVATANPGYAFGSWTGCTTSSGNSCSVTMVAGGNRVTAAFTGQSQSFSAVPAPLSAGSLQCSTGGSPGACANSYPTGTIITVAQTATPGYAFTGWSGACTGTSGCTFSMPAGGTTVTASYTAQANSFAVQASPAAAVSSPFSCNGGTCANSYQTGTPMSIAFTANSGYTFTSWSAPCTNTTATTCTFTMPAQATNVSASFNVQLKVTVTGAGTVSASASPAPVSGGISGCSSADGPSCSATYTTAASSILLTATGVTTGVNWTGCDSTSPPPIPAGYTCTISSMTAARNVTADIF